MTDRSCRLPRRLVGRGLVLLLIASGCRPDSVETAAPQSESTTAAAPAALDPPILMPAPEFALTDETGAPFGTAQLHDRVWVINFIFTRCNATCPRQTERIGELQRRATRWSGGDRLALLSVTVDPQSDTPERLAEYGRAYRANPLQWKFLTGDRDQLRELSGKGFKLPVSESDDPSTPITHSARFVLVDAARNIRGFYDSLDDREFEKLAGDIRTVLSESAPAAPDPSRMDVPEDVAAPAWMRSREARQRATSAAFTVRHDFEFNDRRDESGITFVNRAVDDCTRAFKTNHYDHANGLAAADVDGDGRIDLFFTSQVGGCELWRNLGDGRFENITATAGVALPGRVAVAASFADTDNDGDADLYVTTTRHSNAFFENIGGGCFRDITTAAGLELVAHSSSAEFFDYDGDGRLDLFVTNVGRFTSETVGSSGGPGNPYFVGLDEAFAGHLFPDRAEPSRLYHNEGQQQFRDVSEETGLVDLGWSGDATPIDVNGDGWSDLYVLNMQGNDELWLNCEGKRFERASRQYFPKSVWGGMGVKAFDADGDGHQDLFVTNMHADMWELKKEIEGPDESRKPDPGVIPESYLRTREGLTNVLGNGFYRNRGNGRFEETSDAIGAETYWPWGLSTGDLNADGYPDVLITSCMNYPFRYHVNTVLLNDRGQAFRPSEFLLGVEPRRGGATAAPWFELDASGADAGNELSRGRSGRVTVWGALGSRSSVIFDLDGDGDLDIVTNDFNSRPMVLLSDLSERTPGLHYLAVGLEGTAANRDGLGAIVTVAAAGKTWTQVHDGQSGYLSQSVLPLYFGLADAPQVDEVSVTWPHGERQVVAGPIPANQKIVVRQAGDAPGAPTAE